ADNISRMLRDHKLCALIEVTTPEALAVSELLETFKSLSEISLRPETILLNRTVTAGYSSSDVDNFAREARTEANRRDIDHLVEIAKAELARAAQSPAARSEITRHTHTPVLDVPEFPGLAGKNLLDQLASF